MAGLLALFLAAGSSGESIVTRAGIPYGGANSDPSIATQGPLDYYVDAAGSDSNSCTAAGASTACLTIDGARAKIRAKRIRHQVIVHVGAGTFAAGAYVEGYSFECGVSAAAGCGLGFEGTLANSTLAGGLVTGTAASGVAGSTTAGTVASRGTMTVTGAGWTVSDLSGRFVAITGGTGVGQIRAIYDNTATVITVSRAWSVAPDATSTFAIQDSASIISGGLQLAPSLNTGGTAALIGPIAGFASFIIAGNTGEAAAIVNALPDNSSYGLAPAAVRIEKFRFTGVTHAAAVMFTGSTRLAYNQITGAITSTVSSAITMAGANLRTWSNTALNLGAGASFVGIVSGEGAGATYISRGDITSGGGLFGSEGPASFNSGASPQELYFLETMAKTSNSSNGTISIAGGGGEMGLQGVFIGSNASGPCVNVQQSVSSNGGDSSGGILFLLGGEYDNCTGDAVVLGGVSAVIPGTTFGGTGSTGFGLRLRDRARVILANSGAVTGALGNVSLDGTNAITWAQVVANVTMARPVTGASIGSCGGGICGNGPGVVLLDSIATASLAAASAANKGGLVYDSTLNAPTYSTSAAWIPIIANALFGASSFSTAILNNTDLAASEINRAATLRSLRFTVAAAGTNGGGSTMIFSLCGAPGACATSYGSVTVNCTDPAGTVGVGTVTTAAIPAGTIANWRVTTDGCTLDPIGNMEASLTTP